MLCQAMHRVIIAYLMILVCFVGFRAHGEGIELESPRGPAQVVAGAPFLLTYTVQWEGDADDFFVAPAETDPFEGGTCSVRSVEAYSREGRQVVEQHIEVVANRPGTLTLPEVRVPYREAGKDDAKAPVTYLVAPDLSVEVREEHDRPAWIVPASVVLVMVVAAGLVGLVRRKKHVDKGPVQSPAERVQSQLHEAQRHRLDGDYYAFYQTLDRIMGQCGMDEEAKALKEKLDRRVREVGYQGARPHDDELTGDYRDVERAVARWKEESGQ